MKKKIAALLVGCMILQLPASALAAGGGDGFLSSFLVPREQARYSEQTMQEDLTATGSDLPRTEAEESRETVTAARETVKKAANEQPAEITAGPARKSSGRSTGTGALKLELYNFLGTADTHFTVLLEKDGEGDASVRRQESLDTRNSGWTKAGRGEDTSAVTLEMDALPAGNYLLSILQESAGPGAYLPYIQEAEIKDGTVSTFLIANDYPEFHGYEDGNLSGRFGLLMPGNFVSGEEAGDYPDGKDLEALRAAMDKGTSGGARFDLNGDGTVDLVDLEYFCKFYRNDRRPTAEALLSPRITKEMVEKATASNAKVSAEELKSLFAGDGGGAESGLGIEPQEGAGISEEHPVTIGSEFEEPVSIGAFAIVPKVGSLAAMEDGEVTFTDEEGTEHRVTVKGGRQVGEIQVVKAPERQIRQLETAEVNKQEIAGVSTVKMATASGWATMQAASGVRLAAAVPRTAATAQPSADSAQPSAASAQPSTASTKPFAASAQSSASRSDDSGEDEYDEEIELIMDLPMTGNDAAVISEDRYISSSAAVVLPSEEEAEPVQAHSVVIDLKGQIAVKKVTIRIDKTLAGADANLVEISRVEFLNSMEDHIPDPELSIPNMVNGAPGDEEFTVTWRRQPNVTGYEVYVSGETKDKGIQFQTFSVTEPELKVDSLNRADLYNGNVYTVEVRSVNGEWKSGFSDPVSVTPVAASRPQPPEQIQIKEGYQKLTLSWRKMKSTNTYNIYYREASDANGAYRSMTGIKGTTAEITGLKDETSYEIYMTGENTLGASDPSQHHTGKTIVLTAPVTPNFMLINVPAAGGGVSEAIQSVSIGTSEKNQPGDPYAVVDGKYETAWIRNDWDAGCHYTDGSENKAPTVVFDQPYEMDTIVLIPDYEQSYAYTEAKVFYKEDDSSDWKTMEGRITAKRDPKDILYYEFRAREKFTAKQARLAVRTINMPRISYAELKFYRYHDLEARIYDMYTDSLHMSLKPEVSMEMINAFYQELEQTDPVSGERTPRYEALKRELDNARGLFGQKDENEILYVDARLTQKQDGHITFKGGLNTWQPLGVAGLAGDTVTIYVGAEGKNLGDPTNLTVIAAQYHGESSNVFTTAGNLVVGPNEVTIPKITSMTSAEAGGPLYVNYTGGYEAEKYAVRVLVPEPENGKSSVARIPVLNLAGVADEEERTARLSAYVAALESHDPKALHEKYHSSAVAYDEKNCVFGATDLASERAMLSIPAAQALKGLQSSEAGGSETEKLGESMKALDEMLYLFYQHKGLSEAEDAPERDRMPVSRINIRYQRMFEGAFMYAGGAHIGIDWNETDDMVGGVPVQADESGRYQSGHYFGWGISHEVGHEINEGAYAVAEVTNNYFSVLAQAQDNNDTVRFQYEDVFKKVTSGAKGPASNVFVQLAMYWQLHLAYDQGYNYKTYDSYGEQFDNLFFARVDSYARTPSKAPKGGVKLDGNTDNNLMRLSCAAAQKNLLEFFGRWGMEPDAETRRYAEQFDPETRAIWLASDDQRVQALSQGAQPGTTSGIQVSGEVSYDEHTGDGNQVEISLQSDGDGDLYGYEIFRSEYQGGNVSRRPVAFVPAEEGSYTDLITTVNNRAFTYDAVGYDILLRPTEKAVLGTVRVSHNGNLDHTQWTVTTNMETVGESEDEGPSMENPDATVKKTIERVIDGSNETTYKGQTRATKSADGKTTAAQAPEIVLYLNQPEVLTGLEYRLAAGEGTPIEGFEIYVSRDGVSWERASTEENAFSLQESEGVRSQRILFTAQAENGSRELRTYDASMVKLRAPGQAGAVLAVSELVLYGQTGDKIDLKEDGIGYLENDYVNESDGTVLIPAGSLIFTGTYTGNPAYNSVLLWDEDGKLVGGTDGDDLVAEQLIFAPDPQEGDLRNVSDGIWVYYIRKEYLQDAVLPDRVRAELYRVDNALDQSGQRLVSSTVFADVQKDLPRIKLNPSKEGTIRNGAAMAETIFNKEARKGGEAE